MDSRLRISFLFGVASIILGLVFLYDTFVNPPGSAVAGSTFSGTLFRSSTIAGVCAAIEAALGVLIVCFEVRARKTALIPFAFALLFVWSAARNYGAASATLPLDRLDKYENAGRQIITACQQFADDHQGRWPGKLQDLAPRYLSAKLAADAIAGDGTMPGFDYTPPTGPASESAIVLTSKTAVQRDDYVIALGDATVELKPKPFQP